MIAGSEISYIRRIAGLKEWDGRGERVKGKISIGNDSV